MAEDCQLTGDVSVLVCLLQRRESPALQCVARLTAADDRETTDVAQRYQPAQRVFHLVKPAQPHLRRQLESRPVLAWFVGDGCQNRTAQGIHDRKSRTLSSPRPHVRIVAVAPLTKPDAATPARVGRVKHPASLTVRAARVWRDVARLDLAGVEPFLLSHGLDPVPRRR